jgi:hypothetical protein
MARTTTSLQGPWHGGDEEEADTVSEERKWTVALSHLNRLPP